MNKQCKRCGLVKDLQSYYTNRANKDGLHSWCRPCVKEYNRKRYEANPRTPEQAEQIKNRMRLWRYGLTKEKYDSLMAEQNNACAVCKIPFSNEVKPNVDHDHKCCVGNRTCGLCVRGLLCSGCNAFAGMIETRFSTHAEMFSYLYLHHNSRWGSM